MMIVAGVCLFWTMALDEVRTVMSFEIVMISQCVFLLAVSSCACQFCLCFCLSITDIY